MRSHVGWEGEWSILYKDVETSLWQRRFKNLEEKLEKESPKRTISTSCELGMLQEVSRVHIHRGDILNWKVSTIQENESMNAHQFEFSKFLSCSFSSPSTLCNYWPSLKFLIVRGSFMATPSSLQFYISTGRTFNLTTTKRSLGSTKILLLIKGLIMGL